MSPLQRLFRAYALAPLAAVGTLLLLPLAPAIAVGISASPADGVVAAWLLGIPVVLLATPLAQAGTLVMVVLARLLGADPRTARTLPTLLARAACAQSAALLVWLAGGREGSWTLSLFALPAGLVGAVSFLWLRGSTERAGDRLAKNT